MTQCNIVGRSVHPNLCNPHMSLFVIARQPVTISDELANLIILILSERRLLTIKFAPTRITRCGRVIFYRFRIVESHNSILFLTDCSLLRSLSSFNVYFTIFSDAAENTFRSSSNSYCSRHFSSFINANPNKNHVRHRGILICVTRCCSYSLVHWSDRWIGGCDKPCDIYRNKLNKDGG